jgi:hypothetical protein
MFKNILASITLIIITLLSTGCATSKYGTGEKAYDTMVERFSLQDLDLSAPEFKSLKENIICYFDDNTSYLDGSVFTICYSENEKVNFAFSTKRSSVLGKDLRDLAGYVATRKDNNFQSGDMGLKCPIFQRVTYGSIATCKHYGSFPKRDNYNFVSYVFRNFNNMYIINIGEKGNKEEIDPASLLPKIKEVLLKIK